MKISELPKGKKYYITRTELNELKKKNTIWKMKVIRSFWSGGEEPEEQDTKHLI
jgi:hypothetical protein